VLGNRCIADWINSNRLLQTECISIRHVVRREDLVFAVREGRDGQDQPLLVGVLVFVEAALNVERLKVVLQLLQKDLLGWWIHAYSEHHLLLSDGECLKFLHRRDRFLADELRAEGGHVEPLPHFLLPVCTNVLEHDRSDFHLCVIWLLVAVNLLHLS